MSYSTSLPPSLVFQGVAGPMSTGGGSKGWYYATADGTTTVAASGYFTNGYDLGMRLGDILMSVETDNSYALCIGCVTVASTSGPCTVAFGSMTST